MLGKGISGFFFSSRFIFHLSAAAAPVPFQLNLFTNLFQKSRPLCFVISIFHHPPSIVSLRFSLLIIN